ncbi:MAG: flotillin family protein [Deltaproteobacteria bacterium]|nr:flotillin family protein [Deltaproteobacteria bacterium]
MSDTLIILGSAGASAVLLVIVIVTRLIYICPPNEVLVFSGGHRAVSDTDARVVGYRVVQGGRGIRVPVLEKVDRMNLTNMPIELKVSGAYSKGGIPLNVHGVANVKVSSETTKLANAIERFLDRSREEIIAVARETLEGNLRGVLAMLTPEEVNQDREKFAKELLHEADHDLARLGLELDTLRIQHVSDDKGYLDSIGRRQTAELLKRSRISEAENQALSAERAASNFETQELARVDAEIATARADAAKRILEAQTRGEAMVAEQRGEVLALLARAQADLEVQRARLQQVRLKLVADKVKPAEARKAQLTEQARGAASKIVEEGKATAAAIRALGTTWKAAGDNARQIFVSQKLSSLIATLMQTVGEVGIDKVTVIDRRLLAAGGGGNLAVQAAVTAEQLKQTTGIDAAAVMRGLASRAGGATEQIAAAAPRPQAAPAAAPPAPARARRGTEPGTGG